MSDVLGGSEDNIYIPECSSITRADPAVFTTWIGLQDASSFASQPFVDLSRDQTAARRRSRGKALNWVPLPQLGRFTIYIQSPTLVSVGVCAPAALPEPLLGWLRDFDRSTEQHGRDILYIVLPKSTRGRSPLTFRRRLGV